MESEIFIHTFIGINCCELCDIFIIYYSQWQVYSHLDPLELQTHNSLFSVYLCLREENILVVKLFQWSQTMK